MCSLLFVVYDCVLCVCYKFVSVCFRTCLVCVWFSVLRALCNLVSVFVSVHVSTWCVFLCVSLCLL